LTDILLTHSYHLPFDRKQVRKMQPYPPLATLYAAAVLREWGFSVALFDTMLTAPCEFKVALRQHRPAVVVVYEDDFNFLSKMCLTRMREVCWQLLDEAKGYGAIAVAHGSDATDHAADYIARGFDYVVVGEGEYSLRELVSTLFAGGPTDSLAGLVSLDSNARIRRTAPARPTAELHEMPLPARDLISLQAYRDAWISKHGMFSMNMISSRGCPFRCNWCAKPVFGDSFHARPAAHVAAEMSLLKRVFGATHLWFGDDIFALNRHWAVEFAAEVQHRGCSLPFKIQTRADLMTADTAEALSVAGCSEVWMGVESGSQRVLDAMDKGLRVAEVGAARANLKRVGIRACYFLQFGYPGETWEDIQQTVDLVRETRPDDIGVSLSYPLPNTRFHERVRIEIGAKQNWMDSDDLCVTFKGTYTDEFYRAVRDALHAEVDTWKLPESMRSPVTACAMWDRIEAMEPLSRNHDATFQTSQRQPQLLIPLTSLSAFMEGPE